MSLARAMRCPVLTKRTVLPGGSISPSACCATKVCAYSMPGDLAYGAVRDVRTEIAYGTTMSSTEIAYGATGERASRLKMRSVNAPKSN
eukprot:1540250-Rhodomonas_salina.6